MKQFYWSAKTSSFYPKALLSNYKSANTFPKDAIEVEDSLFEEYSGTPPEGKIRGVGSDGLPAWVDYTEDHIELNKRAAIALSFARSHVRDTYLCLGEAVPEEWIIYQKALIAIDNGTDTTSTELPKIPNR